MSAAPAPWVTIGIPCFNRERLIGRAIASVLAQDHRNIRLVISDNNSTDRTGEICRACAAQDSRITYVRQPHNIGPTNNFEEVLRRATDPYFMWLGDDDWLDPGYVSAMLRVLEDDPAVSLASGFPVYYQNGHRSNTGRLRSATSGSRLSRVLSYYWGVEDNGAFYGLMRTDVARRSSLGNVMGGDWIFVANLAAVGKLVMLSGPVVHRELGGATASYQKIAATLGLSKLHAWFPYTSIAVSAFSDVVHVSPTYRSKAWPGRLAMATAVFLCIVSKYPYRHAKKLAVRCRNLVRGDALRGAPLQ